MNHRQFSRREFFAAMAAGGAVIAGELWIPGQMLISIPMVGPGIWLGGTKFAVGTFSIGGDILEGMQWDGNTLRVMTTFDAEALEFNHIRIEDREWFYEPRA